MMHTLTTLESAVLQSLLDGPGTVLAGLRRQLEDVHVAERKYSGVGFFSSLAVDDEYVLLDQPSFRLGDVLASLQGVDDGVGFVLVVRDGRLAMLEAYTFGSESWPEVEDIIDIQYVRTPRDLPSEVVRP